MTGKKENVHENLTCEPSDHFLRAIEETSPVGVIVTDKDAVIRHVNRAGQKMLGYEPEEMLGRNVRSIIHPAEPNCSVDVGSAGVYGAKLNVPFHIVFIHRDGTRRQVDAVAVDAFDHPEIRGNVLHFNNPVKAIETSGDFSDSEKKYRLICENAREIILLLQDGVIKFANNRAETMTGYSLDELVGRSMMDFILPESIELAVERHVQAMAGKTLDKPVIYRVRDRWGNKLWLSAIGIPTNWEGFPSVLFFGEDVTEQVEAENALRESEEAHRTIFDFVGDGVVVIQDDRFVFANPKTAELFGLEMDDLFRRTSWELIHPDEREMVREKHRQRVTSAVKQDQYEFRIAHSSGQWREVEVTSVAFIWKGRPASLAIFRDISDRRQRMAEALQKEKLKGAIETAGAVCHELNQPLQSILGQAQLLSADLDSESEYRGYVDVILEQTREVAEITKKLQGITQYATTTYVKNKQILDLDKASEGG